MPEEKRTRSNETAGLPALDVIRVQVYRLLASVFAARDFYACGAESSIYHLALSFEDIEATQALVSVAFGVRLILERGNREGRFDANVWYCGKLIPDISQAGQSQSLHVREACNKVIHAKRIAFDVDNPRNPSRRNPVIHLYGKRGHLNWSANLNLLEFAQNVLHMTVVLK